MKRLGLRAQTLVCAAGRGCVIAADCVTAEPAAPGRGEGHLLTRVSGVCTAGSQGRSQRELVMVMKTTAEAQCWAPAGQARGPREPPKSRGAVALLWPGRRGRSPHGSLSCASEPHCPARCRCPVKMTYLSALSRALST